MKTDKEKDCAETREKYKKALIKYLGNENIEKLESMEENELFLAWNIFFHEFSRLGMKVRNTLQLLFPSILTQFKDYQEFEDWSFDLIKEILKENKNNGNDR